ncbi:lanthionine synthetase C family protein [Pseudoalteromonas luteoviolacea]|uniref:lanthionine synthetase C family protein n=1 Tax=Pseudoalteromonas luteoviolacea TaxID=43657 RepID=UPI001B367138|nr:lanthionine synthetase C family protein [Pseudoalteromonas luteoviolacea]MBQ4839040.1 lanthionine synthetase C family protein [Pseudoalteromonas luteoviolacea]
MSEQLLITDSQRQEIGDIITVLAQEVSRNIQTDTELKNGLLSGLAGQLLFLFKAHQLDPNSVDEALFSEKLELLQEQLAEQSFELSTGLAGQAWVLEYLNQADQDDYDAELLEDVDELFTQALDYNPWPGEIEMVLGLSGYAPYAARRSKYSDQTKLFDIIVSGLESTATYFDNGHIAWSQPKESVYRFDTDDKEKPEFNLGLAHGVPGMIGALLPALKVPSLQARVAKLVSGACDWLLENQTGHNHAPSCYGSCAGEDEPNSRLGWCYGDITIALILARAGQALDRPSYVDRALEIALHATKRDAKSGYINDAGLCHGFVGLALIFQIVNQCMPNPQLVKATQYWVDYSLNEYRERGLEALYSFNGLTKEHEVDYGFLMGFAGIGCGLVSLLDDDVSWTDCLLMV